MEISLLTPADRAWAAALEGVRRDVYHLPAYSALSGSHEGGDPVAVHVVDGPRTMLLPLILRPVPGGGCDGTSPYGYPGPVGHGVDDPEFLAEALRAAGDHLRSLGCVSLFLRLHPTLNPAIDPGSWEVVEHGLTVGIDLRHAPEVAWQETRENHQRGIKRALRDGFVAEPSTADADFDAFRRVYDQTMRRLGADAYYFFDASYYEDLRTSLSDHLVLIVVRKDADVAAAGLFFEADRLMQYHLSGSDERYLSYQPTKLMIHEARRWGHERGDDWLHLGGGLGAADDSLFQFKAGFSPLRHAYRTLRMVVDEPRYRALSASPAGPLDLRDFFPAYRRSGR